jgi:hypothetical protein
MADIGFSFCGKYIFNVDRYVLPDTVQWPVLVDMPKMVSSGAIGSDMFHPVVLEEGLYYIALGRVLRVYHNRNNGLVFLEQKKIDTPCGILRRLIGVLMDSFIAKDNDKFLAVWPLNVEDCIQLVVLPVREMVKPLLIKTSILSRDLFDEREFTRVTTS